MLTDRMKCNDQSKSEKLLLEQLLGQNCVFRFHHNYFKRIYEKDKRWSKILKNNIFFNRFIYLQIKV